MAEDFLGLQTNFERFFFSFQQLLLVSDSENHNNKIAATNIITRCLPNCSPTARAKISILQLLWTVCTRQYYAAPAHYEQQI